MLSRIVTSSLLLTLLQLGGYGQSGAQVLGIDHFDVPPALASAPGANVWYVDRYAPQAFDRSTFAGGNRLHHAISTADAALNRPAGQQSTFYNTQGRKFDLNNPVGTSITADLYVPASWQTQHRRADLWATMGDDTGAVSDYPIIGFANTTGANPAWRVWRDTAWVNIPDPPGFTYDAWYTLRTELTSSEIRYFINGTQVYTVPRGGSSQFLNIILQAYNFGDTTLPPAQYALESYDVYWDNVGALSRVRNTTRNTYHLTIQDGVNAATAGDTIGVAAGTFPEGVVITRPLTLLGPNAGVNPSTGVRNPEAIITPAVNDTLAGAIVVIDASDVTLSGFTLDGDSPSVVGGIQSGGADVNTAYGVTNDTTDFPAIARVTVRECIIRNVSRTGVRFRTTGASAPASSGSSITNNLIENILSESLQGTGVWISYNFYAAIAGNIVRGVQRGITSSHFYNPGSPSVIEGNTVEAVETGIWHNLYRQRIGSVRLALFETRRNNVAPFGGSSGTTAFKVTSIFDTVGIRLTDNYTYGIGTGIQVWNTPTLDTLVLQRDTVENFTGTGVLMQNADRVFGPGANTSAIIDNCFLVGPSGTSAATGALLQDDASATSAVSLVVRNQTEIDQGENGIILEGARVSLEPSALFLSGQTGAYIRLRPNIVGSVRRGVIDATRTSFEGSTGSGLSDSELLLVEQGIVHGTDLDSAAFVRVKPGWVFIAPGSGNLQRGINVASAGDHVRVFNGTYVENVVVPSAKHGLVLSGQNAGVVNGSRSAETIINGSIALLADRSVVDGFQVNGGGYYGGDTVGVLLNGASVGQIVRATRLTGPGVGLRRGILAGYGVDSVVIDGNSISGWTSGVYLNPTPAPRGIRITRTMFSGNVAGIGSDGINNTLMRANAFLGNSEGWGYSDVTDTGGASLRADSNSFSGNGTAIRNYTSALAPDTIYAPFNIWGSVHGPTDSLGTIEVPEEPAPVICAMRNTLPTGSTGDAVSERVAYYPWIGRSQPVVESVVEGGWNLMSLSRRPSSFDPAVLFPGSAAAVFGFNTQAQNTEPVTVMDVDHGYWVKYDSSRTSAIAGQRVDSVAVTAAGPGWILIAAPTDPSPVTAITTEPAGAISGVIFRYNRSTQLYEPASGFMPGEGYWVKVDQPCRVRIR
jgi:hypothetical protein